MADESDDDAPEIDEAVWRPLAASVFERVESGEACVVVGAEEWDRLTAAGNPGGEPVPLTRGTADEAAAFLARTLGGHHEAEAFSEVEPDGAGGWRRKEGGADGPVHVLSGRTKAAVDGWKRARDAHGTPGQLPERYPVLPHILVVQHAPEGVCWELFALDPYTLRGIAHFGVWAKHQPGPRHCRGPMGFDDRWRARFVSVVHDGLLRAPPDTLWKAMRHHGVLEYRGALPEGPIGRRPPPDFGPAQEFAMSELEATQGDRERRLIDLDARSWETGRPDALSGGATLLMTRDISALTGAAAEWVGYRGPSRWFEDLGVADCREADPGALARAYPSVAADLARERAFGEPFFSPGLLAEVARLVGGGEAEAGAVAVRAAALLRYMALVGREGGAPSARAVAAACRVPLDPHPPVGFRPEGFRSAFLGAARAAR